MRLPKGRVCRRWLPVAQVAAALCMNAGRPEAAPPEAPYVLNYAAPHGCPEEAWFITNVASHVHDTSRAGSVRVNATIEEHESGYWGTLVATDPSGVTSSRRIEGKKCSEIAHALAFLTALALELGGHVDALTPSPPPSPAPPTPIPQPRETAIVSSPRRAQLSATLLGGVRGGLGPSPRPSGEADVEIASMGRVLAPSLRLGALVATGSLNGALGSAALWLVAGRLELCPLRFARGRFAVRPCLGGDVGVVRAEGQTEFSPRTTSALWASAEATLSARWFATSSWFVELDGGLVVPLERTRYYFLPNETVYTVPGLTARAGIGMGRKF